MLRDHTRAAHFRGGDPPAEAHANLLKLVAVSEPENRLARMRWSTATHGRWSFGSWMIATVRMNFGGTYDIG
jgi:hypothetical protein